MKGIASFHLPENTYAIWSLITTSIQEDAYAGYPEREPTRMILT